jgi:hypothetical protein
MDEDGKEKLTHLDLVVPTGYRAILARAELTLADVLGQIGHAPSQEGRGGRI